MLKVFKLQQTVTFDPRKKYSRHHEYITGCLPPKELAPKGFTIVWPGAGNVSPYVQESRGHPWSSHGVSPCYSKNARLISRFAAFQLQTWKICGTTRAIKRMLHECFTEALTVKHNHHQPPNGLPIPTSRAHFPKKSYHSQFNLRLHLLSYFVAGTHGAASAQLIFSQQLFLQRLAISFGPRYHACQSSILMLLLPCFTSRCQ